MWIRRHTVLTVGHSRKIITAIKCDERYQDNTHAGYIFGLHTAVVDEANWYWSGKKKNTSRAACLS